MEDDDETNTSGEATASVGEEDASSNGDENDFASGHFTRQLRNRKIGSSHPKSTTVAVVMKSDSSNFMVEHSLASTGWFWWCEDFKYTYTKLPLGLNGTYPDLVEALNYWRKPVPVSNLNRAFTTAGTEFKFGRAKVGEKEGVLVIMLRECSSRQYVVYTVKEKTKQAPFGITLVDCYIEKEKYYVCYGMPPDFVAIVPVHTLYSFH